MAQAHSGDTSSPIDFPSGSGEFIGRVEVAKTVGGTAVAGILFENIVYDKHVSNAYPLYAARIGRAANRVVAG